ncbi:cation-translocating P-type ATPase [Sinomonas notoginsengisoli]|uniref:HAD-IC family P-type ATPase n=1 Tax=Sinomonas notoginsengisoli TaxID=1457311 RepID=UPI001F2E137C|nr:HAD-IC family P-type ATPase [Sinomonas notoginsengisoli]
MPFLSSLLQALVEPARQLGVPSLPQRLLDAVVPDRVAGRRAWAIEGRAAIEAKGVNRPGSTRYIADLERALEEHADVTWARVNAPLGRVVICFRPSAAGDDPRAHALLTELVAIVDRVEAEFTESADNAPRGRNAPVDRVAVERAAVELAADVAGLAAAAASHLLRLSALPQEIAAAVSVVDSTPRLRGVLERQIGEGPADLVLALTNAAAQAMSRGVVSLSVDAAQRYLILAEARAESAAWRMHAAGLLESSERARAAPIVVERPRELPPGPVEVWADRAGLLGAGAFGIALAATRHPRQAVGFALAALPKAGRAGREAFSSSVGRHLASRGAIVLDAAALRRLDRVTAIVLDVDLLTTGRHLLGQMRVLPGADPKEVAERLHALFRPDDALSGHSADGWTLAPLGPELSELSELPEQRGTREQTHRGDGTDPVLGLVHGGQLKAMAAVIDEPHESLEALAAAGHRSGHRLVLAGRPGANLALAADDLLPGGPRLVSTVRDLQAQGEVVMVLSGRSHALAAADVGVGVVDPRSADKAPPWGAHILAGQDYALAALLMEASAVAADVSRRSVMLAQAATAIGGVSATAAAAGSAAAPRSLLAVNTAAAISLAMGVWSASRLIRAPMSPPISRVPWHAMPSEAVLEALSTSRGGLSSDEARRRLRGTHDARPPILRLPSAIAEELNNPLTPILGAGAALSAAIGAVVDAGLVAAVALASAVIGGVQRSRTDRALEDLLSKSALTARVLRDDAEAHVAAEQLVPGDIVLIGPGEVVPADCRILEAIALQSDESSLTGEPFPLAKSAEPIVAESVAERSSMLYEGTTVAAGRCTAVVVATGFSTEAGRSMAATRSGSATGGVEARLAHITDVTLPITLVSAVGVIAAGLLRGRPFRSTVGAGVSLAVAAVPEGLPFLVSAAQLASARRLSTRGTLVRNPRTIEALGRVDVLGFDKTGTLTEGRIRLESATGADGKLDSLHALQTRSRGVVAAGLRATPSARRPLAHMTDRAISSAAREAGISPDEGAQGWKRLSALPFEPSRSYHATLASTHEGTLLSVKGAPETVLARCTAVRSGNRRRGLDEARRRRLTRRVEKLASEGYRLLAVAEARLDQSPRQLEDDDVVGLTFLGFLALTDPVRPAAAASVEALRAAGVQILMITGDHPGTAAAVAQRLDLLEDGGRVITGTEIDALGDDELARVLPHVAVVARGTPAHKVRVVQTLQGLGKTVAMTGDGANDAPAIRLADVGIALGRRGTPAARAAGDLVVTDDRLETIIAALVEGRAMWGSVREALGILVGGNLGEIAFTLLGALATGLSPLRARQLLLVNLLTDLAPALAVALRPPHAASTEALLAEGPEASLGSALTREVGFRAALTTAGAGAGWALARLLGLRRAAPTVGLVSLVATQLGQTITVGGPSRGVVVSGAISLAALAAVIQTPGLSAFFGSVPLGPLGWGIAAGASLAVVLLGALVARRKFSETPEYNERMRAVEDSASAVPEVA